MHVIGICHFDVDTHEREIGKRYFREDSHGVLRPVKLHGHIFQTEFSFDIDDVKPTKTIMDKVIQEICHRFKNPIIVVNGFAVSNINMLEPCMYYDFQKMGNDYVGEKFYDLTKEERTKLLVRMSSYPEIRNTPLFRRIYNETLFQKEL